MRLDREASVLPRPVHVNWRERSCLPLAAVLRNLSELGRDGGPDPAWGAPGQQHAGPCALETAGPGAQGVPQEPCCLRGRRPQRGAEAGRMRCSAVSWKYFCIVSDLVNARPHLQGHPVNSEINIQRVGCGHNKCGHVFLPLCKTKSLTIL